MCDDVSSDHRTAAKLDGCQVPGQSMKKHPRDSSILRFLALRQKATDESGQDITRAPGSQSGVWRITHPDDFHGYRG